jgi:hypothetical protein
VSHALKPRAALCQAAFQSSNSRETRRIDEGIGQNRATQHDLKPAQVYNLMKDSCHLGLFVDCSFGTDGKFILPLTIPLKHRFRARVKVKLGGNLAIAAAFNSALSASK